MDSWITYLLNIAYIQMIRAKKLKVVRRSLLHQGLLRLGPLRWRRRRILSNCKLMLVALTMMKMMKTTLIQKTVNILMMRFVCALNHYEATIFYFFSWSCVSRIFMDILVPEVKELPIPNLMHLHLVSYVCESKFSLYLNVCRSVIQLWIVRLMVDLGTFALFSIKIGTVIIGVKWNDEFNAP